MDAVGDLVGVGAIGLGRVDADPVAGGAGELGDFRGGVASHELVFELEGVGLGGEGADLDAPAAGGVGVGAGGWSEGFDADFGDAHAIEAGGLGGGEGEIDDASVDEGAAVGDADDDGLVGGEVGDADGGAHGQGAMGGGHGVVVVDGAVGGFAMGVGGTVPAGEADFGGDGLAVGVGAGDGAGGCGDVGGFGGIRIDGAAAEVDGTCGPAGGG